MLAWFWHSALRTAETTLQPFFLKSGPVVPLGPSLLWTTLANARAREPRLL